MLRQPDKKPYKITAVIFIVVALISIFLKVKKGDANIFFTLAMLLSAIGALNWFCIVKRKAYEAAKRYEEALSRNPDYPSLLYNCAIAGLMAGDRDFGLGKLDDFLKKYPLNSLINKANKLSRSLRNNIKIKHEEICYAGEELRRQGKLSEAEQEFKKELSINHDADWAYYGLVLVYVQMGNYELALENLKKFKGLVLSERDIRVSIANELIKMLKNNQVVNVDEFILQSVRRSRRFLHWWVGFMGFIFLLFIYFVVLKKIGY